MANKAINDLTAASTPLAGTELAHIVQSGNSRKVTAIDLARAGDIIGTAIDDADIDGSDILTLPTDGNIFAMGGTQTVDAIAASVINRAVFRHTSARTFTHHATDLICPGGVDLTVNSGDVTEWFQYASGDWICINVQKAIGAPIGLVGRVLKSDTTTTTSTTLADITGVTLTFTALAGRQYRISFRGSFSGSATNFVGIAILRGSTVLEGGATAGSRIPVTAYSVPGSGAVMTADVFDTPGAGSVTYKVQWYTSSGTAYLNRNSGDSDSAVFPRTSAALTAEMIG